VYLDASQLAFLYRLGKSPEGQQLQMLISAEIAQTNEQLRKLSGDGLLREQGRAVFLDDLMRKLTVDPSARTETRRPKPFDSTAPNGTRAPHP